MTRVLALDAAGDGCSAGLVVDGVVLAARTGEGGRGQAAVLPRLVQSVWDRTSTLDLVAVTVGPGSFTGIRAALALAHGIALGAGVAVAGVTVGAAFEANEVVPHGWTFRTAMRARAGHIFLQHGPLIRLASLDALPSPDGPVLLAGNAAPLLAGRWASHGVRLLDRPAPGPADIARAALLHPGPAEPVYVEAPRTTAPRPC